MFRVSFKQLKRKLRRNKATNNPPAVPWEERRVDFFKHRDLVEVVRRPVFAVGTGRCGTHFIAEVFKRDSLYDSKHLDDVFPTADAFQRYCAFHGLPVDVGGLIWSRRCLIDEAAKSGKAYFESNPMLIFNVGDLCSHLSTAYVMGLVRSPIPTVASIMGHRVYDRHIVVYDPSLASGYQYAAQRDNHSFSALVPRGDEFKTWSQLTEVGKTAWLWNAYNSRLLKQLKTIPEVRWRLFRIEEFTYEKYLSLGDAMELSPLTEFEFEQVRSHRPGKSLPRNKRRPASTWTARERHELCEVTSETAAELGYDVQRELAKIDKAA